jgi:hypothetical protein
MVECREQPNVTTVHLHRRPPESDSRLMPVATHDPAAPSLIAGGTRPDQPGGCPAFTSARSGTASSTVTPPQQALRRPAHQCAPRARALPGVTRQDGAAGATPSESERRSRKTHPKPKRTPARSVSLGGGSREDLHDRTVTGCRRPAGMARPNPRRWLRPTNSTWMERYGSYVRRLIGGIRLMRCVLREVRDEDLAVLFEQWADPVAVRMPAFTALNHVDRDAFEHRCPG